MGDEFRIFNGRDGEWLARLDALGKKEALAKPIEQIKAQPPAPNALHLVFAPPKKQRLSLLIEKAVELGATHLHPVLTAHTENRHLNTERIKAQTIEAAEQCERMHIPALYEVEDMKTVVKNWSGPAPLFACIERHEAPGIDTLRPGEHSFLIGSEGGFNDEEIGFLLKEKGVKAISLGETVYRAETACIICLVKANAFV